MSEAMRKIRIEKITLNIGTGKPGPELEKAKKLLQIISGAKPVETKTKKRIPAWSLRPGLSIGCKVTLRGKNAEELLARFFQARGGMLSSRKIDREGNLAFGIKEYLDIQGLAYEPEIGVIGFEVAVTLARPGFSIQQRKLKKRRVPNRHRITKEDTMRFFKEKFGVNFVEE